MQSWTELYIESVNWVERVKYIYIIYKRSYFLNRSLNEILYYLQYKGF